MSKVAVGLVTCLIRGQMCGMSCGIWKCGKSIEGVEGEKAKMVAMGLSWPMCW